MGNQNSANTTSKEEYYKRLDLKLYKWVSLGELRSQFQKITSIKAFSILDPIMQSYPIYIANVDDPHQTWKWIAQYWDLNLYQLICPKDPKRTVNAFLKLNNEKLQIGLEKSQYDMFFVNII